MHVGGRPEAAWEFVNLSAARDLAVLTGPLPASHGCYVAEAVSRILNRLETARLGRRRLVDACFREAQRALPWPGMRGRGGSWRRSTWRQGADRPPRFSASSLVC